MAGEDVGAPPDHLWVHQEGIYRDEYQRTWVAVVEEVTVYILFISLLILLSRNLVSNQSQYPEVFGFILDHFFPLGDEFPKGTSSASSGSFR